MRRWILLVMVLGLGLGFQVGWVHPNGNQGLPFKDAPAETPFLLKKAAEAIHAELLALDQAVAKAAQRLSTVNLGYEEARGVLGQLLEHRPEIVVDACTISPEGVMLLVEPAPYRSFEGTDIRDQEQVQSLQRTRQPVMSHVFRTVEGIDAVDLEHPVFGTNGQFLGSVSVIFQPWALIEECVKGLIVGMPVEIWAMQPDGRILYDADPREVGRLLFTDQTYQAFPELLQLGRRMAAEATGSGSYSYLKAGTDQMIHKDAWWLSLTLHGATWRLVSIHPTDTSGSAPSAFQGPFSRESLRSLARDPGLIQALARGDREEAMNRLRQAVTTHPNIYSLSWVDVKAVNRFGYPPENSLFDVDLRTQTDEASVAMVKALDQREEIEYVGALVEGGRALYSLAPIWDKQSFLGALLWMEKK